MVVPAGIVAPSAILSPTVVPFMRYASFATQVAVPAFGTRRVLEQAVPATEFVDTVALFVTIPGVAVLATFTLIVIVLRSSTVGVLADPKAGTANRSVVPCAVVVLG